MYCTGKDGRSGTSRRKVMPGKVAIIEQIGERGLLLPELIARGLVANDRVNYFLTLLQSAQARGQRRRRYVTRPRRGGERQSRQSDDIHSRRLRDHRPVVRGAATDGVGGRGGKPGAPGTERTSRAVQAASRGAQRVGAVLSRRYGHGRNDQRPCVALEKWP